MRQLAAIAGAALLTACSRPEQVLLNDRLFEVPATFEAPAAGENIPADIKRLGGGCDRYDLASSDQSTSSSGELGLAISQRSEGDAVTVLISRGGDTLVHRSYDFDFFESGRLDEFLSPTTTHEKLFFRYWGQIDDGGKTTCPPVRSDGP